jgi:tRNA dimethylallyltransferase
MGGLSNRLVVIVGPTGAGKTRLALALARRAGAEIVSADSQQVYVGMDIGTGKATAAERAEVAHHLIDVLRPDQEMTAARFVADADAAIADIAARGRSIVVCGGTGLYVRALLLGLFEGPAADPALRARLEADADAHPDGTRHLHGRLAAIDPDIATRIEPNDRKRIVRALEVHALTGVTMSAHQARHDHRTAPPRYEHTIVGVAPDRDALYRRIDARVDDMVAAGLLDEVAALRARGFAPPLRSQAAIGYAELHDHLAGAIELTRAVELIKRNSRRYARRQISWYRPDQRIAWHSDPSDVDLASLERYLAGC